MAISKTEDNVRDNSKIVLGFDDNEKNVQQGTGQITTFNKFGIKSNKKPDGWYLPNDIGSVAIILETKANSVDIHVDKWRDELLENVQIASSKYSKVIGILYNGEDIRVFEETKNLLRLRQLFSINLIISNCI